MSITINLAAGTPQVGLWCPKCLLPTGYDVLIYGLFNSGPRSVARLRKCFDCGTSLTDEIHE